MNVAEVAQTLVHRLETRDFAGWDPYDALSSPLLAPLGRTQLGRQVLLQGLRRSPVNLRRPLLVPERRHTKGLALIVAALARLSRVLEIPEYAETARELGNDLHERALHRVVGVGWGYDFDVQTRWGRYTCGTPNAVVTSFVACALADAATLHRSPSFLSAAQAAARFAVNELFVETGDGAFFAYFPGSRVPIHNASMLVAGFVGRVTDDPDERDAARAAVRFAIDSQAPDGSWPYGESSALAWVDGYHTAYILDALMEWRDDDAVPDVDRVLSRALAFYCERLIDPDGAARASVTSRFPVDIHGCASAIATLSRLATVDPHALPTATRVLEWTLANMRRRDGRFAHQLHRRYRNSVPYVRWNDAHMLNALAWYLEASSG